jgi:hypothetical protein
LRAAAHELTVLTPQQLAQTVSEAFASDDTKTTWTSDPDTVTAESTASATMELPPEPKPPKQRRKMPWIVVAASVAVVLPLSFGVVHGLIRADAPVVIRAEDRSEAEIRRMLEQSRFREAAAAMSIRAEDRLPSGDALGIVRLIYDATSTSDWKELEKILAKQLELEAQRRR